jgi:6-phosphogluconolactonase (cycloisomerase 2 family)
MTMRVRAVLISVLLATMSLAGCGHYNCGTTLGTGSCSSSGGGLSQGGGNNIGQSALVYFMDDGVAQMAAEGLNIGNSQTYAPVSNFVSPIFPSPTGPNRLGANGGMVIVSGASKKYLYMPFANGSLYAFSIDATTSALTGVPGSPYTGFGGTSVAADPAGHILFVGGISGVSAFMVNANDGSLTMVSGSPFSTGGVIPVQLATDGVGKFLYMVDGATITAYAYNSVGVLAQVGSPLTSPMILLSGEKSGKYMLGITEETGITGGAADNNIYVFSIGSTGAITALPPFPSGDSPLFMAVSPNGGLVYTFNENGTGVSPVIDPMQGFTFDSSAGTLAKLSSSPFTGLDASIGRFDQSGSYLFSVASVPNSSVAGTFPYGVSNTGALSNTLAHAGVPSTSYAVTDVP